ncbi:hypothetical protein G4B88_019160 [Cannabis sativa]|uniref:RNase H type-1 domain-containing protein n=1 Tax=Cannabis sativa TaxID=3483 RepID=A0A7J6HPV1_CANSA|nr:hypothetical protein G4B88_019160 [Cannabis sativa]
MLDSFRSVAFNSDGSLFWAFNVCPDFPSPPLPSPASQINPNHLIRRLKHILLCNHSSSASADSHSRNRSDGSEPLSSFDASFSIHSLQHAVNQFLRVQSPTRSITNTNTIPTTPTSPHSQTSPSTIPPPIMTTSTVTHTAKGKGIALPSSTPPRTRPIGLVINDSSPQSSPISSAGTRKHFTRQTTQDYQEAQIHSSVYTVSGSPSPAVLDQLLTPSTTALFVDAALSLNASATGLGMVFVQGMSHIHHYASINKSGASSPIFAEAQALAAGLQWCLSSNLTPEYIFSDCLNLVSKVKGNWHDHSPLSTLVHQIRTFLSRFPEASLLDVSCQHNDKAHSLAKQALRLRDED